MDRRIFICYRRDDTAFEAGRIHERLKSEFGKDNVFLDDEDHIPGGADFGELITRWIVDSHGVVAVIGKDWLGRNANGRSRLDDPGDFLRIELETALRHGIPVFPILVEPAKMPEEHELPHSLKRVKRLNAIALSHASFGRALSHLIELLKQSGPIAGRRPQGARATPPRFRLALGGRVRSHIQRFAAGVAILAVGAALWWLLPGALRTRSADADNDPNTRLDEAGPRARTHQTRAEQRPEAAMLDEPLPAGPRETPAPATHDETLPTGPRESPTPAPVLSIEPKEIAQVKPPERSKPTSTSLVSAPSPTPRPAPPPAPRSLRVHLDVEHPQQCASLQGKMLTLPDGSSGSLGDDCSALVPNVATAYYRSDKTVQTTLGDCCSLTGTLDPDRDKLDLKVRRRTGKGQCVACKEGPENCPCQNLCDFRYIMCLKE